MKETEIFCFHLIFIKNKDMKRENYHRLIKNSEYGIGKKILVNISFFNNMKLIPEKKMESFQDGT